jgi:hypothetical protein
VAWRSPGSYSTVAATGPSGPVSVKLDAVSDEGSASRTNVARTAVDGETPDANGAGSRCVTVNGWRVVKLHVTAAGSAAPVLDRIAVVSRAVYVVPSWRSALGSSRAVRLPAV